MKHWQRLPAREVHSQSGDDRRRLTAGVFDLSVAARGIVDDNYGWEVWESANRYPAQRAESDLETLNLSAEEVYFNTEADAACAGGCLDSSSDCGPAR